ncbi:MAG TPA: Na+/H+ antiporter NhaA [Bryobacteraceae bacterium]|nr:Na+/H+ antiporter NhaA [Bryobacteraceae bacterium]
MAHPPPPVPRAQLLARQAFETLYRFIQIEAVSGIALLVASAGALIWANSSFAAGYEALWHTNLSLGLGDLVFSRSLHYWINDVLMTVFFLVVGMEIRREMHEGSLADFRQAALPVIAALGGVLAPASIYLALHGGKGIAGRGWAVPTATDIAFAVGVLALLGKSVPGNVRIFLLALAIIDDIIAVLIIALFYSGGLDYNGLLVAAAGILAVLGMQAIGVASAYLYTLPGAIIWFGLLWSGAHPALAGVVLGLMTPVLPRRAEEQPLQTATRALDDLRGLAEEPAPDPHQTARPLRRLRKAQRELLPPVTRVQLALHPWVAFGILPLFALANAGVNLSGIDFTLPEAWKVMLGVSAALVLGKPIGVISASWLAVRSGICRLPTAVTWSGVTLIGLLAGIGFTMAIFMAALAFGESPLLDAAKAGVLVASFVAGVLGLFWGKVRAAASPND